MSSVVSYDKIILCFKYKKEDKGKYIVNGIALDVIKQGDYVNIVSPEGSSPVFCGFVRRIYYGDLANSELPLALPGEKHTFLIILESRYVKVHPGAKLIYRLLSESDQKSILGMVTEYIGKAREIVKKENMSWQSKLGEIKRLTFNTISQIKKF